MCFYMIGYESRCKERDTVTVQVSRQVLSRRCFRRTDSGSDTGMDDNGYAEGVMMTVARLTCHDLVGILFCQIFCLDLELKND